jgi:concanavalin A-like lectin/glucanase superfamily protein
MTYETDVLASDPGAYFRFLETSGERASLVGASKLTVEAALAGDSLTPGGRSLRLPATAERLVHASTLAIQGRPATLSVPPRLPAYEAGRVFGISVEFVLKIGSLISAPDPVSGLTSPLSTILAAGMDPLVPQLHVQLVKEGATTARILTSWPDRTWSASRLLEANHTYHVVAAIDGTRFWYYINGVETADLADLSSGTGYQSYPQWDYFVVGSEPSNQSHNFVGEVSEIALYDSVLSDATVKTHFRSSRQLGFARETQNARPMLINYTRPIGTAIEKQRALPIGFAGGQPPSKVGLTLAEKTRLLADSLTDVELGLVTEHRGEEFDGDPVQTVVLATTPLGFWWLGDATSPHVDVSGNSRNLTKGSSTTVGPSIVPSEPAKASTKFNAATNDYGSLATAAWMEAMQYVSTMAVFKPEAPQAAGILIARTDYAASFGPKYVFTFTYNLDASFTLTVYGHTGSADTRAWATSPAGMSPPGETYRAYGTYDGAVIRLYINGELVASTPFVNTVRRPGTADLSIGRTAWTGGAKLDGWMSAVGLWDRALTPVEIETIDAAIVAADLETDPLAHEHQPVEFVESGGVFSNAESIFFTGLEAAQVLGWQLWSQDHKRRLYGYWNSKVGSWLNDKLLVPTHGLQNGDPIVFQTASAPDDLDENVVYYVRDADVSTFKVSATLGGSALSGTGTGIMKFGRVFEVPDGESLEISAGQLTLTF